MKLFTEFLLHLLFCGFVGVVLLFGFAFLSTMLGFALIPISLLTDTQCPQCKGFFKRKLIGSEVVEEKQILRTVNRIDQGVVHSNHLLEPNYAIEINRKEQVTFVEKTIRNHWACKNTLCGHEWNTDEFGEYEGSLIG